MNALLAFDRASSVRRYDEFGRLHVALTNISKATVNPYRGNEIPDWETLRLDPERVYWLYRDPVELARAAPTFNNIPLLDQHLPVLPEMPQKQAVCGSTGTDCIFEAPYLKNSLVIWTIESIAGIETRDMEQLSCSYKYRADMTPGVADGVAYDGVMRDIVGNHVALVDEGRAGPDVLVADRQPEKFAMSKKRKLSPRATALSGALKVYLGPKLAGDAKLDIGSVLVGVTAKNYAESSPKIVAGITALTKGKLAADAKLDSLPALIATFANDEETVMDEEMEAMDEEMDDEDDEDEEKRKAAEDEEMKAKDEAPESPMYGAKKPAARDAKPAAMDAATIEKRIIAKHNAIRTAEREVRPHVGEIAVAMDSAESVYKFCLEQKGVDLNGVEPVAYRHMVRMLPDPEALPAAPSRFANDRAEADSLAKRFPTIRRFQRS